MFVEQSDIVLEGVQCIFEFAGSVHAPLNAQLLGQFHQPIACCMHIPSITVVFPHLQHLPCMSDKQVFSYLTCKLTKPDPPVHKARV